MNPAPRDPPRATFSRDGDDRGSGSSGKTGNCRRPDGRLAGRISIAGRVETNHQTIAGGVPAVSVRSEQIENNPSDRWVLLKLVGANRANVSLVEGNALLLQAKPAVRQVNDEAGRGSESLYLRDHRTRG